MTQAYYNEHDPKAAAWLRELIKEGHIAPGDVDERDIQDVTPSELSGYTQCHFFAGIGVWSFALRKAGWSDDRPVWTGSCPCQPFSAAGKGEGFDDERHLWPAWHWLIEQCRPGVIFGEQVASKDGLAWLDLVQADLEGAGYASGTLDLCAAGIGAPHIRQRLFFVAERLGYTASERFQGGEQFTPDPQHTSVERTGKAGGLADTLPTGRPEGWPEPRDRSSTGCCDFIRMAHSERDRFDGCRNTGATGGNESTNSRDSSRRLANANGGKSRQAGAVQPCGEHGQQSQDGCACRLGYPSSIGRQRREATASGYDHDRETSQRTEGEHGVSESVPHRIYQHGTGPTNGFWTHVDWLGCRDGKWRPVEPGTFPLVNGAPERVGLLRGYGNAIVAPLAQAFIEAYREVRC